MMINNKIEHITKRIILRSQKTRELYLSQMLSQFDKGFSRSHLSCGNVVHAAAGCGIKDKEAIGNPTRGHFSKFPEHQSQNEHRQKGPNEGPRNAHHCLLVAHEQIAPGQKIKKF